MQKIDVFSDHGTVSKSAIEGFEKEIGFCFPQEYKILISNHNGLSTVQDSFDFTNQFGETEEGGIRFYGYGGWPVESIEDSQDFDIYGHDGIVSFGRRGNGDHICFDYRHDPKTCEPRIVLMLHDEYTEDTEGNAKHLLIDIAPNFEAFIDMLYKYEDDE